MSLQDHGQQVKENDPVSLYLALMKPGGILCPILGFHLQETH